MKKIMLHKFCSSCSFGATMALKVVFRNYFILERNINQKRQFMLHSHDLAESSSFHKLF